MKFAITVVMALATSYLVDAVPINVTNNSNLCYCRANTSDSVSVGNAENEAYKNLNDSLMALHTYCNRSNLVSLFDKKFNVFA